MPRTRNNHIQFWLSDFEARDFNRRVKRSGLSREAYLRQIIRGLVPTEAPPTDYFQMMGELRRIGVNLNQLSARANAAGIVDATQLRSVLAQTEDAIKDVTAAVIEPKPSSTWMDAEPKPAEMSVSHQPWTNVEICALEDELATERK